ncbi:hypothetical protein ACW2Q0_03455 [Nocardia sp. R16R-3T]
MSSTLGLLAAVSLVYRVGLSRFSAVISAVERVPDPGIRAWNFPRGIAGVALMAGSRTFIYAVTRWIGATPAAYRREPTVRH